MHPLNLLGRVRDSLRNSGKTLPELDAKLAPRRRRRCARVRKSSPSGASEKLATRTGSRLSCGSDALYGYARVRCRDADNGPARRQAAISLHAEDWRTGTVLPDSVLDALEATPRITDTRYFWSGQGKRETVVCHWQMRLKKVFDLAKVSKGEGNAISHRFRDTFAMELLLAGVPIERVSILLGHQSVRVTERHYNPWVRSRQEQLEADVASAWKLDPVLNQKIIGTNRVHLANGKPN
jgi:Phage integrase family